ncbi:MAG: SurA N-terminal domain-containing protein, partial [Chlamydiota bacterium]|nr:SurA N-terminal domain-containing protein [Chlamydiota bacterium]
MIPFASIGAIMNEVVATVNGDVITAKELEQIIRPLYAKYKRAYSEQETIEKIEKAQKEALDQLIDRKLVSQEAKRLAIEVTDKEIDQRLR